MWYDPPQLGPWQRTRERLKIIRQIIHQNQIMSDAEIGRKFGISRAAVHALRVRYGIPKERSSTQRRAHFIELVRAMPPGLTPREMGAKLGLSEWRAYYYARLTDYRFPSRQGRTDRRWKERFKSLPPGLTLGRVAECLGISYIYAVTLCQRYRYKVRHAQSSKPPHRPRRPPKGRSMK